MKKIKQVNWKKIALHLILWVFGFSLLLLINFSAIGLFSITNKDNEHIILVQDSSMFWMALQGYLFWVIIPIYINTYILITKIWYRYNFFLYLLSLCIYINLWLIVLESIGYSTWDPTTSSFILVIIGIQTLAYLSLEGFKHKNRLQTIQLEQSQTELSLLKAQINPHFLFNALNNLYSLSLFSPKETPEAILELSSLMRYSVESSKKNIVSLEEEIQFIRSYIFLAQMRINPQKVKLLVEIASFPKGLKIAPMLLIPFIENVFKHGIDSKGGDIFIQLNYIDKTIKFLTKNTIAASSKTAKSTYTGLENTQKRLTLLYPQKHHLVIKQNEHTFEVNLTIIL